MGNLPKHCKPQHQALKLSEYWEIKCGGLWPERQLTSPSTPSKKGSVMKRVGVVGTLLLVIVLSAGCASAPSPEAMKAEIASFQLPKLPEPGKAICYVVRPSGAGALIKFNVFVDDQQASSELGY